MMQTEMTSCLPAVILNVHIICNTLAGRQWLGQSRITASESQLEGPVLMTTCFEQLYSVLKGISVCCVYLVQAITAMDFT